MPYIVQSDDISLHPGIWISKITRKSIWSAYKPAHHALVVAQEHEGLARAGRDGSDESLSPEVVLPHYQEDFKGTTQSV